jgi:hypothetical protein
MNQGEKSQLMLRSWSLSLFWSGHVCIGAMEITEGELFRLENNDTNLGGVGWMVRSGPRFLR